MKIYMKKATMAIFVATTILRLLQAQEVKKEYVIFEDEIDYAYTYPEDGKFSFVNDNTYSGSAALKISWDAPKGEWCGAGIAGKEIISVTPFKDKGVLVFYVKGEKGDEKIVKVGLMDWGERYTTRPFSAYLQKITKKWQKVEIPLSHFSEKGMLWDEGLQKEIPTKIDFSKIKLLTLDFGEGDGKLHTIYIDSIKILPTGGEKSSKFEPVKVPEGVISLFEDTIEGYAYTYPEDGLFSEDFDEKVSGASSLKIIWRAGKGEWCGAGVAIDQPVDLSKLREEGARLEFWIKGAKGVEVVEKVGLMDENEFYTTRMLAREGITNIPNEWKKVSIPLKKFSDEGLRWDEEEQKEIPGEIDWTKIKTFTLDFGEGTGEENVIYIDEVRIVPPSITKEEKKTETQKKKTK